MITSLSTSCLLHLPLRRILRLVSATGYNGIELVLGPEAWLRGPERTRRLVHAHALSIVTIHQSLWPITPAGTGDARMLDAVRFAKQIGCPTVVIHGPWTESWDDRASLAWLRMLDCCQEELASSNTRLALENVGVYKDTDRANVLAANDALRSFCQERGLGITLDTCHVGADSPSLIETYQSLAPLIANVHFSDIRQGLLAESDWLNTIDSHHQLPGAGRLALAPLVQRLGSDGYDGPITIEVSPAALQAWSSAKLRRNLQHSLEFVDNALACLG